MQALVERCCGLDVHQERVRRAIGLEPLVDAQVERRDVRLDGFEPAQLHRQEEAVMFLEAPVERQDQIRALAAQLALGEIGHRLGRGLALDQRPQHRAARHAEDVASDTRQLDVGGLQQFQQPVALSCLALDELAAISQ